MGNLLETILGILVSTALTVWQKLWGTHSIILETLTTDEATILTGTEKAFIADLQAGKGYGVAAADAFTFALNQEGKEFGKVAQKLLDAFISAFDPKQP